MLFLYPMWDSESQRIGKKKCAPLGYRLNGIAELLGFIGLILLTAVAVYLKFRTDGFRDDCQGGRGNIAQDRKTARPLPECPE